MMKQDSQQPIENICEAERTVWEAVGFIAALKRETKGMNITNITFNNGEMTVEPKWIYNDGVWKKSDYDMKAIIEYYRNYRNTGGWLQTFSARKKAHERFKYIMKQVPDRISLFYWDGEHHQPTMLDVGCGDGDTMREFKNRGWEVSGVEYSKDHIEKCRKYGKVYLANCVTKGRLYDVIIMGHVLEHQPYYLPFLEQYKKHLKPNGVIYIEVPNAPYPQELDSKELGERLSQFPTHLYEFTKHGLKRVIRESGWEIVNIERIVNACPNIYRKDVGHTMLTARFLSWKPDRIIIPGTLALYTAVKSLFTGTLQKEVGAYEPYLHYGDYLRAIVK